MARFLHLPSPEEPLEEDPLAGVANLFDVSVVFIVGLMITLFSIYRMGDLIDPNTEVTMVKTNAQGEQEIIVKKGTAIDAYKVTGKTMTGNELTDAIARRGRPRGHGFVVEIPLQVAGERVGGVVAAGAILLDRLQRNPVELALERTA